MSDDNYFLINVQIGGFRMPLRVLRKDEEIYRNAEKLLVKYLDQFQKKYSQRGSEEILILAAYQMAVAIARNQIQQDLAPLEEKIQALDKELEELLNRE